MPVHTTLDPNVNAIVEIVRCPVPDGGKKGIIDVVFLLQDGPTTTPQADTDEKAATGPPPEAYDLVRVNVPRETRTAGYFNYRCVS